jgi:hypothetical protein
MSKQTNGWSFVCILISVGTLGTILVGSTTSDFQAERHLVDIAQNGEEGECQILLTNYIFYSNCKEHPEGWTCSQWYDLTFRAYDSLDILRNGQAYWDRREAANSVPQS